MFAGWGGAKIIVRPLARDLLRIDWLPDTAANLGRLALKSTRGELSLAQFVFCEQGFSVNYR